MHVLVPIDDSDPAEQALEYALAEYPDADITALHVIDPYETSVDAWFADRDYLKDLEAEAETLLENAREIADDHGASIDTDSVVGKPAREITDYVDEADVDEVVIGSHGRRGTTRVLLGSVAETVVRRAPVPVIVVR
ncbi:Nucleotide-binding universal stress protein, UspA family [Halobiforma haloterrestris]|uniref:Nucleotide-binding universal stress protein, UspA family n=1 Tax=Natronobacterium haloterrestre TaxID=148448 RepID=A0A1I1KMV2_NATHA|nr:universal stress protein [Halobiforma haloterrestris]SFC61612.1 Nucleotide-binding universal stress protein, UspA family [Halobiforma haloterrestris]